MIVKTTAKTIKNKWFYNLKFDNISAKLEFFL